MVIYLISIKMFVTIKKKVDVESKNINLVVRVE